MAEVGHPAHSFQLIGAGQFAGQSYLVNSFASLEQIHAGGETGAVPLSVEVVRFNQVRHPEKRITIDQECSNHRFLRLNVVGKEFLRVHLIYSSASAVMWMVAWMSADSLREIS